MCWGARAREPEHQHAISQLREEHLLAQGARQDAPNNLQLAVELFHDDRRATANAITRLPAHATRPLGRVQHGALRLGGVLVKLRPLVDLPLDGANVQGPQDLGKDR
eukprot:9200908-Pyramimonas_sp.AAC.1